MEITTYYITKLQSNCISRCEKSVTSLQLTVTRYFCALLPKTGDMCALRGSGPCHVGEPIDPVTNDVHGRSGKYREISLKNCRRGRNRLRPTNKLMPMGNSAHLDLFSCGINVIKSTYN